MRNILAILVDRANYGRMKPVLSAIQNDPDLKLDVMCTGTMVLPRFGNVVDEVVRDGFPVTSRVYMEIEGSNTTTMSKSIGLGIVQFSSELERINPDIVLVIGDRYEALGVTISAAYMNLTIAHIQGGEVSGSIDESCRHAITKFSHLHFPSTKRAAEYLIRMGEDSESVFFVGCPAGDYIKSLSTEVSFSDISAGVGANLNLDEPFLLVIFHPVTTKGGMRVEADALLEALHELETPTIWLWPNIDAGADRISTAIRAFREKNDSSWLYLAKHFEPEVFQKLLKKAACAIGNSSSFIRDTTFTGTPVVLVGDRQVGRERGENILESDLTKENLIAGIRYQVDHGRYEVSDLYGSGDAALKIVEILKSEKPEIQKTISYIKD